MVNLDEQDYKNIYISPSLYNHNSNLYKNDNQQFNFDKIDKLREKKMQNDTNSPYASLEFHCCQQDFTKTPIPIST